MYPYRVPLYSYSLVNVTLNMRYKNDKKYQIHHQQICFFFKLKMHQNPFSAETPPRTPLRELPVPLVGWRGRYASLFSSPLHAVHAFGVSISALTAPRFSGPLNTNSWLRQCFHLGKRRRRRASLSRQRTERSPLIKQESSAKLTNQRVSYAFTSSPFSFHTCHILPASKFQYSFSCILLIFYRHP